MKRYEIPKYYFDPNLSEEEKQRLDWEIINKDFPIGHEKKD